MRTPVLPPAALYPAHGVGRRRSFAALLLLGAALALLAPIGLLPVQRAAAQETQDEDVKVGRDAVKVRAFEKSIKSVVPAIPDFADIRKDPSDPKLLRITGKSPGRTNVLVVLDDDERQQFSVTVTGVSAEAELKVILDNQFARLQDRAPDLRIEQANPNRLADGVLLTGSHYEESSAAVKTFIDAMRQNHNLSVSNYAKVNKDRPTPKPIAQSLVVLTELYTISEGDMRQLGMKYQGVNWSASGTASSGGSRNTSNFNSESQTGSQFSNTRGTRQDSAINGVLGATTGGSILYQDLTSHGKRLDSQQILVQDGSPARKQYGQTISVRVAGPQTASLQNVDVGNILEVTPSVLEGGKEVRIDVTVESSVPLSVTGENISVSKDKTSTAFTAKLGEPYIVGNTFQQFRNKEIGGVPYLKDVPVLGELFKDRNFQEGRTEAVLVITVTPYSAPKALENSIPESARELLENAPSFVRGGASRSVDSKATPTPKP